MFDVMELYLIIFSMRKYVSKKSVKNIKTHQQQELFLKVSRTLTSFPPRHLQHTKAISTMIHQIKRPQTSKKLKNDYENLIDLANCNRKITQSQQKSIMRYKQMKSINSEKNHQFYRPLFVQIQNTQGQLYKKKYKKYEMSKLNNYLHNSSQPEQISFENLIQNIMSYKIKDIKNCIPSQAKLSKKITILGDLLQQQKQYHIEEIKKIMMKEMQKNGGEKINRNCQIYIINHYIIEQLLLKVHNDSSALGLKTQNRQIYEQIKKQMVEEIIKQKTFKQVLKEIQEHQKISYRPHQSKVKYQPKNKYPKSRRMSSVQNLQSTLIKNKQIDLTTQFQNIYQKAQQKLKNARSQLSFSSPRKNNYFSSPEDFLGRFSQL